MKNAKKIEEEIKGYGAEAMRKLCEAKDGLELHRQAMLTAANVSSKS